METKKRKNGIKIFFLAAFSFLIFLPFSARAYLQNESLCYSQCAAYKFVWQGDYCYDLFQDQCSTGEGNSVIETIKFLKSIKSILQEGEGAINIFKAWFVCKPLIENCIAPQLQACHNTCQQDQLTYAPDISVGSPYGSFVYHGVVYNENDHTLTFKVVNNGMGYAWDIEADASWGHTRNRDGMVSGGGQLLRETIPELIYMGARNGPAKSVSDYIADFLIEESNFSKYLQGFKSDANDYNVPIAWYKTIPFTAPEGELTKVTFNVDSSQMIPERSENNNSFTLVIDKLPTPPSFQIENFSQVLESGTLNNFLISFDVKNSGEENGQAEVKIYEGKYSNPNQNSIYNSSQVVQGLNKFNFSTFIAPDVSTADSYCGKTKTYTLVVFDDGQRVDSFEFSLPLYSGTVRGRVEDLFGKNVSGATVRTSTGQTAVTSESGSYTLKNIPTLGKVTLTVTRPEFSQTETKEIELKMGDPSNPCAEGSLTFNRMDFVLQDQEVLFNVIIKDRQGNPINAHVLAANQDWRFENDINGQGPLPGMQPGAYYFTLSAPGYKTIAQDINAVPNDQDLEFVMEKINGRPTDGGLEIHAPQLLWQIDRGSEIFSQMVATKDGKEVLIYTSQNREMTGKLYFLDAMTGQEINVLSPVISTKGQSQACLDTSYDGNTTALYAHTGSVGIARDTKNVLKLYNRQGGEIGTTEFDSGGGAHECDVSPDGFYIYPDRLLNKGLHVYTRSEIEGIKDRQASMGYSGRAHFLVGNNVVAGCNEGGGQCVQALDQSEISNLGQINGVISTIDSNQNAQNIIIISNSKVYLFSGGSRLWEKDVITRSHPLSAAVSPGGKYAIYSTYTEQAPHRTLKIFTDNNLDRTPESLPSPTKEDVLFVTANDKGIFFATSQGKTIKYYQVGSYSTEYNPESYDEEVNADQTTNAISYYENGTWNYLNGISFSQLLLNRIHMANDDLNLQLPGATGSLKIAEGTLFGVDQNQNPVLLKGQMTTDFASPQNVYAIKFDRYDLALFQTKLEQFTSGQLPESEYMLVRNIHTKYAVINQENSLAVRALSGDLEISFGGNTYPLTTGEKLVVGEGNGVKIGRDWRRYLPHLVILIIIILSGLLFKYRETKTGALVILILKKIYAILKTIIFSLAKFLWQIAKKIYHLLKKEKTTNN